MSTTRISISANAAPEAAPHAAAERDPRVASPARRRGSARAGTRTARGRRPARVCVEPDRGRHVGAGGQDVRRPTRSSLARRRPASGTTGRRRSDSATTARRYVVLAAVELAGEPGERVRVAGEQVERPRERGRRRLVAREQQRHQLVADLVVVHPLAVLEARRDEQREDVLARRRRSARRSAISRRAGLVDRAPAAPASCASGSGRRAAARAARRTAGRPRRCRRAARAAARAGASRRSASATPNTARRITSSVIACMLGWTANGAPVGQRRDLALGRLAHDRLVRAHPLAVERRQHQPAARRCSAPSSSSTERAPDDRPQRRACGRAGGRGRARCRARGSTSGSRRITIGDWKPRKRTLNASPWRRRQPPGTRSGAAASAASGARVPRSGRAAGAGHRHSVAGGGPATEGERRIGTFKDAWRVGTVRLHRHQPAQGRQARRRAQPGSASSSPSSRSTSPS